MPDAELRQRLLQELSLACDEGRAVAVHSNRNDPGTYEVAFVQDVRDIQVTLKCLTPRGEPDGISVVRLDDIFRVDVDTAYCRKIELLNQYQDTVFERASEVPVGDIYDILMAAKASGQVVHVLDYTDYGPAGFVQEVGQDFVTIKRISQNGEPDGLATIGLDCIASVHVGRRAEQIIAFLYRYNTDLRKLFES